MTTIFNFKLRGKCPSGRGARRAIAPRNSQRNQPRNMGFRAWLHEILMVDPLGSDSYTPRPSPNGAFGERNASDTAIRLPPVRTRRIHGTAAGRIFPTKAAALARRTSRRFV